MSLRDALSKIDKMYGSGTVQRLGDNSHSDIEVIPTGSIALDRALGIGGLPRGRIVEIYGPESSGKSTVALHVVANAQRLGTAAYVDTEHAIDPVYARALGVDVDNMLISQPDCAEQALEIMEVLIDSGEVSIVVLDSVAAMVPRRELEGDYGDSNVGLHARIMSQAMRKLVGRTEKSKTVLLCINQIRQKVGIVYGSPEVTTGGLALKYYSSVRMDIRRIETEKSGTDAVGNRTRVKVVKNKLAPPLRTAEFSIDFGRGISKCGEILDLGIETGLIKKSGAWLKYDNLQWQGRANALAILSAEVDIRTKLETDVIQHLGVQ